MPIEDFLHLALQALHGLLGGEAQIEAGPQFAGNDVRGAGAGFTQRAGCTPSKADDTACFVKYAQAVGRRVLRRTVTAAEAQTWATTLIPYAVQDADFYSAVEGLVAMWLQHPEFLYRVETGAPAVAVDEGWVVIRSLLAASAFTVNTPLTAFNTGFVVVAVSCLLPPVTSIRSPVKVAVPLPALMPRFTAAVPCNGPVPAVRLTLAKLFPGNPLVAVLPN